MERKQKVKEILGSAAMQQGELRKLKMKKWWYLCNYLYILPENIIVLNYGV
jgi:hypothetical protein